MVAFVDKETLLAAATILKFSGDTSPQTKDIKLYQKASWRFNDAIEYPNLEEKTDLVKPEVLKNDFIDDESCPIALKAIIARFLIAELTVEQTERILFRIHNELLLPA